MPFKTKKDHLSDGLLLNNHVVKNVTVSYTDNQNNSIYILEKAH